MKHFEVALSRKFKITSLFVEGSTGLDLAHAVRIDALNTLLHAPDTETLRYPQRWIDVGFPC